MRKYFLTIITVIIALLAFGLLIHAARAHDSWISKQSLRNKAGEWCCGAQDCTDLNYTPVVISGGVELQNGETIPYSEIMPISPDGWTVCRRPDGTRRCVFAPPNGS